MRSILSLLMLLPSLAIAQGLPIKGGSTSDLANVNTAKALETAEGESDRATYEVHVSGIAVTVLDGVINLEAEVSRGFRISQICISPGSATAAAYTTWQLIRTTTASSAGTPITSENTTTHSISKMDPGDANWGGLARFAATEGTSGAVLDAGTIFVNITGTPPAVTGWWCREYGMNGGKLPTVVAGTANGVKLMWTGLAGGANFAAMMQFIAD
jgi:hypothetical protein